MQALDVKELWVHNFIFNSIRWLFVKKVRNMLTLSTVCFVRRVPSVLPRDALMLGKCGGVS